MATPAEEISFDPSTAQPLEAQAPAPAPVDSSGFDPSTAQAVEPAKPSTGGASGAWGAPNEGLSFLDKIALASHDTFQEKELYLQKVYGKHNVRREWGSDGSAQLIVTKNGRQVAVSNDGMGFLPETAANIPEAGGGTAGALFGAEAGTAILPGVGTAVGSLLGAGIGTMLGHSMKETAKSAAGTYAKTPGQLAKSTLEEGGLGMASEIGGQVVGKGVTKMLSGHLLPDSFTGSTPKTKQMTETAWSEGAMPHWPSIAPDARKLARIEIDAEKLTGKYEAQARANEKYVINEVRKTLEKNGVPNPHVSEIIDQLTARQSAFSGREAGELLQKTIRAQSETMEQAIKTSSDDADRMLGTRISNIDRIIENHPPGALAEDVEAMTRNAKKQFTDWASQAYGKIDAMLGGRDVVPVEPIREAARQIKNQLPRTAVSAMTQEMSALGKAGVTEEDALLFKEFGVELPPGEKISLKDAQRIRTILREKGDAFALTRNTVKGDHLYLANAVDRAIQNAAEDPSASAAIAALNTTDAAYKNGIAKFNDLTFKQMVKAMKSGMPPDPQKIASMMLIPGQTAKVGTIRKVLGDEVFKRVQSADLQNLLKATQSVNVVGNRMLDGMKLLDYLHQRTDLVKAVHGNQAASDLLELGKSLAARKGDLPVEALARGDIRGALTAIKANEKRLDDHLKKNLLAELADPSRTGENVYRWVVTPGQESRVMEVVRQFGENSPQMQQLRQTALEELARNANIKAVTENSNKALENALSGFTQKQKELLFPGGMSDDIHALSEVLEFMYPGWEDVGMAGMHVGGVLEKPAFGKPGQSFTKGRLFRQATAAITRMLVLHPSIARWLVIGRNPKTPWIQESARIVEGLTRAEIYNQDQLTAPPEGTPPHGQPAQPGNGQSNEGFTLQGAQ